MNVYDVGDAAQLLSYDPDVEGSGFKDASGTLTDPSTVTLVVTDPNGAAETVDTDPVSTGRFSAVYAPSLEGLYAYTWTGSGNLSASESGTFYVRVAAYRALRVRLRGLLGGDVGDLTDQDLDAALGEHRVDVAQDALSPALVRTADGTGYTQFRHPRGLGDWAGGVALLDSGYQAVTPDSANLAQGVWSFDPPRASPVLWISGSSHDLYAAAASVADRLAAQTAGDVDLGDSGASIKRSQKHAHYLALAAQYRRRARPVSVSLGRSDAGDSWGNPGAVVARHRW